MTKPLSFMLLANIQVAVLAILSSTTPAACPNTIYNDCICPEAKTSKKCATNPTSAAACTRYKKRHSGKFCCIFKDNCNYECVDSESKEPCYEEADCEYDAGPPAECDETAKNLDSQDAKVKQQKNCATGS